MDDVFAIKQTRFLGKPVAYICQNVNGPCPLLAIANVLLLRGHISLSGGVVSAADLLQVVLQRLLAANPPLPENDELGRLTQQKTLQDVQELLPSLLVGLDVNVRFHSIMDFEYTVACAVFDMLDMALVHGWLLDVQDEKTLQVVQNKSYNELIERLVDYRGVMMTEDAAGTTEAGESGANAHEETQPDAGDTPVEALEKLQIDVKMVEATQSPRAVTPPVSPSKKTVEVLKKERQLSDADATDTATALLEEGPILEEFFAVSASQLTYYGLVKLHEDLRERQLAVFFRNNHFSTIFKINGALFLLVTDAGYLDEPSVVWERLNEIDGDTEYYDENFQPLNVSQTRQEAILKQQEEARRKQMEGEGESESSAPVSEVNVDEDRTTSQEEQLQNSAQEQDADYLLALKLQQEEEERARGPTASAAHTTSPPPSNGLPPRPPTGTYVAMPRPATAAVAAVDPRESSESYDSQPPSSQGPYTSSEGDAGFAVGENGELLVSEAELQAQRDAELFYQQQKLRQQQGLPPSQPQGQQYYYQQQQQQQYQPNRTRRSTTSDCLLM